MNLPCDHCGKPVKKRSRTLAHVFCSQKCTGRFRRKHKSKAVKRAEKAAYDREYRAKNQLTIKLKKHRYFKRTYDPVIAAELRKKRMPKHVEYCRQPRYRQYKRVYDEQRRAKLQFGEFAESFLLLRQIENEVAKRASDYEIRLQQGTINKKQKRERELCQKLRKNRHRTH